MSSATRAATRSGCRSTATAPIGSPADKAPDPRAAGCGCAADRARRPAARPRDLDAGALRAAGFSDRMVHRFFRPLVRRHPARPAARDVEPDVRGDLPEPRPAAPRPCPPPAWAPSRTSSPPDSRAGPDPSRHPGRRGRARPGDDHRRPDRVGPGGRRGHRGAGRDPACRPARSAPVRSAACTSPPTGPRSRTGSSCSTAPAPGRCSTPR